MLMAVYPYESTVRVREKQSAPLSFFYNVFLYIVCHSVAATANPDWLPKRDGCLFIQGDSFTCIEKAIRILGGC